MSTVAIRPCRSVDELVDAASILAFYSRRERDAAWARTWLENFELERMLATFEDGAAVGAVGAFRSTLSVPGGNVVPTRSLTLGGVLPSHRRRGIFDALITRHLADAHEQGEPLSYVIPVSEALFRRFGFGVATHVCGVAVPRRRTRFRPPFEPIGRVRHVDVAEALELFPDVYARALALRPGMLARTRSWWEFMTLQDPPYRRGGGGAAVRAVLEVDGAPEGYAIYRLMPADDDPDTTEAVQVVEAVAASDRAEASLWRYLLDVDHVAAIRGSIRVDHPLPLLLDEAPAAQVRLRHGASLRLIDVGAALGARAYAGDGALVLDVRDDLFTWNAGRWKVEPGATDRTTAAADLALDVADLASAYLGGVSFGRLRAAGCLEERRTGAVERADALFGGHLPPWCVQPF